MLKRLVEIGPDTADVYVLPELLTQRAHALHCLAQPGGVARHAAVVPHQAAKLAVELVGAAPALRRQELLDALVDLALDLAERGMARIGGRELRLREIVADRIGEDEVAVGETLHQRAGT